MEMLDDGTGLAALLARGLAGELERPLHIHWAAYLGTPDEMLVAGRLNEVGSGILSARAEARARKGWVMDIFWCGFATTYHEHSSLDRRIHSAFFFYNASRKSSSSDLIATRYTRGIPGLFRAMVKLSWT